MRRLGWAGVEIDCGGETLLIDYIQDTSSLVPLKSRDEPFPSSSQKGRASVALLTHLHADHADPAALTIGLQKGATVFRPASAYGSLADLTLTEYAEAKFIEYPLSTEIIGEWDQRSVGPFHVYSAPAVDGFGDPQLTWIVECGGQRIIHAGDTLFHGFWWRIANKFGPFDVAFLPINAPVVAFPFLQPPSTIEAVMNPEEAALAARILKARLLVPIHYDSLHKPPIYIETMHPVKRLLDASAGLGLNATAYKVGEWFSVNGF